MTTEKLNSIESELLQLNNQMHNLVSETIYPLSDALQLEIEIYTDGANNFELKGSRNWILPIAKNDFKLKLKIEASTVSTNNASALVHISKNFWLYISFDNELDVEGLLTVHYLDIKSKNAKIIQDKINNKPLDEAMAIIQPFIKISFEKTLKATEWVEA